MNISDLLQQHASNTPDKTAIRFKKQSLSYAQLNDQVIQTSAVFDELELQRGDRVVWYGMNHPEMLVLLFAAARNGLILVPLNWRLALPELQHAVRDCQPAMIFHDRHFTDNITPLRLASDEDCGSMPVDAETKHDGHLPAFRNESQGQQSADKNLHNDKRQNLSDPLMIVYTSGTTGQPKGAVLDHNSFLCNARMSWHMHKMTADDRILGMLPMFHVGGFNIQVLPALLIGAQVTLLEKFDPQTAVSTLAEHQITLTVAVPTVLQAIQATKEWANTDLSTMRALSIGSTDVPIPLIESMHDRYIPVIQVYGSTETSPLAIYQQPDNALTSVGSIGRCGSECEIRLVQDGKDVAEGENGEIWVRGDNILNRYWNNPHATDANIIDGWFRTGDVARRDADGFYWFADRLKHVIISGGENIYPAELERVIRDFPGLKEMTIVGRSHQKWGEVAVVVAVRSSETPASEQELRESILAAFQGTLARFKHPRDVVFVDALPRTALGKVQVDAVQTLIGN